ncbi:MAG TPA: alpha-L-fucosidase [Bacteroidales bacterium]|nr:alpha-L-fucosidase [Bacteroidales bacterium]
MNTIIRKLTLLVGLLLSAMLLSAQDSISWPMLRQRANPQWFTDARLGIFIHWGVYSVPAYGGPESYAEWYLRGLQTGAPLRVEFMRKNYGSDFTYRDFAPLFKAELFDPDEWAAIFERAGAKYIILVAKHHDGYCLWPSRFAPGWNSVDNGPGRDIVGELAQAVRRRGMRFGLYYSLPEWDHPLHRWYTDPPESIGPYVEQHMIPQLKELIEAYKPDLLFTDGEWFNTAEQWHARELISWYYNLVGPDAIVNDRWGHGADIGFVTPEYSSTAPDTHRPWAEVRGLGRSFGLNRNEKLSAYMSSSELVRRFVWTVAHGGGLIINLGPAADGQIPLLQQERVEALGQWIERHKEAIYGAKPWIRAADYGDVALHRTDTLLQFNWVRNSPGKPIAEDYFSAEWTGWLRPDSTAIYTFTADANDAAGLWINGTKLLDTHPSENENAAEAMRQSAGPKHTASVFLEGGKYYPIRLTYNETVQNAHIRLSWQAGSAEPQTMGKKHLFTSDDLHEGDGLVAVYRSKQPKIVYTANHGHAYAIVFGWPGKVLRLPLNKPHKSMSISLLPDGYPLPWRWKKGMLTVDLSKAGCPAGDATDTWVFRIEGMAR